MKQSDAITINLSEYRKAVAKRRKGFIQDVLIVVFGTVFIVCALELLFYYGGSFRYRKSMKKVTGAIGGGIAEDAAQKSEEERRTNHDVVVFPDEAEHELVGYVSRFPDEITDVWKEKYAYLSGFNKDCFGYIEIPGTILSWPVMFTPENYEHYLYRNFSNQYEQRGLPFMDRETKPGLSQNYLMYGHNMNDGMNFGTLRNYLKYSYYEEHPYVYFNTALSEGIYQIMYVCRSRIYGVDEDCFKYYNYAGILSENEFRTYVREMEQIAIYTTGISAEWGDELLTLSTCDHYVEDGRLVIVCKRIQ